MGSVDKAWVNHRGQSSFQKPKNAVVHEFLLFAKYVDWAPVGMASPPHEPRTILWS